MVFVVDVPFVVSITEVLVKENCVAFAALGPVVKLKSVVGFVEE
jgi:hypothetical protein